MRQAKLMDEYITRLREDPAAAPPSGLDPELASTVRQVALSAREPAPPLAVKTRIWMEVLHAVQPPSAQDSATWSRNGKGNSAFPMRKERKLMTTLSQPLPRTFPVGPRAWALIAAALAAVIFFGGLLPALLRGGEPGGPAAVFISQEDTNKEVFLRYLDEIWNKGNMAALDDLVTADFVRHEAGSPDVPKAAMPDYVMASRTALPDGAYEVSQISADGDWVWTSGVYSGTFTGPLAMGPDAALPPNEQPISFATMNSARFVDGKIAEQWVVMDSASLWSQLGATKSLMQSLAEQRNAAAARAYMEALYVNRSPEEAVSQYRSEEPASCDPMDQCGLAGEDFRATWREHFYEAFPDGEMTITSVVASGDMVFVQARGRGHFTEPLDELMSGTRVQPTQKVERWTFLWIFTFNDEGKWVRDKWYWYWDGWPYAPPA